MIKDLLLFMLSYGMVFILTFAALNFMTHGFTWKYIKIWLSRGSKILMRVNGISKWYIAIGKLEQDDCIHFKNLAGKQLKIQCKPGDINRWHGVSSLMLDEYSGSIIKVDLSAEERATPAFYSALNDRIIKTVNSEQRLNTGVLILVGLLIAVGVILTAVYAIKIWTFLQANGVNLKGVI